MNISRFLLLVFGCQHPHIATSWLHGHSSQKLNEAVYILQNV